MAEKQYLDDNGNPIAAPTQKQYLDPNTGEPIKTAAPSSQPEGFWNSLQNYVEHPEQRGEGQPTVLNRIGGGLIQGVGQVLQHPIDSTVGAAWNQMKDILPTYGPGGMPLPNQQGVAHAQQQAQHIIADPAHAAGEFLGQAAVMAAAGEAMPKIGPGALRSPGAALETAKSAAARLVPSLIDGPPESLMTRAVRPGKNNTGWNADVQKAVPLMKSAEEQLGRPVAGIDDALEAAQLAKKGIWQQYQARLGASGETGATIDGNAIADQMVGSIDKRTALQNPGLVDKVKAIADTYRRPLSLNEAEDFLQSANKDLNTYYTKNKVGQQVAMNDPEISSTVAEADALRKGLYSKLDQVSGPGAAQLKQAYGSLTNVEKELYGRQLVAARQAPESLSEQLSTVRGAGKIAKGVFTASPGDVLEGAQNIAVSRALKARNSSDAMIERAFQAAQPATPFPAPAFRAPQTTLLLPEKSGAKTPLMAPDPGMSAGERSAAMNQWLRQRQQLALPAQSTPIRLPPPR